MVLGGRVGFEFRTHDEHLAVHKARPRFHRGPSGLRGDSLLSLAVSFLQADLTNDDVPFGFERQLDLDGRGAALSEWRVTKATIIAPS